MSPRARSAPLSKLPILKALASDVQQRLDDIEIAHFKMTFSPDDGVAGELASINLVRSDYIPELGMELDEPTQGGQLIINLRAEDDPETLHDAALEALRVWESAAPGRRAEVRHSERFRPAKPTPTYRMATA